MDILKYRYTVNCTKTAEPIKMQLIMLSWVGPGNMYYMAMQMPPREGAPAGDWTIEKHCKASDFGGLVKGLPVQKNG